MLAPALAGLLHHSIHFFLASHVVPERKFRRARRRLGQLRVAGDIVPLPDGEPKPWLQVEESDGPVLELRADDSFRREPQPIPVEPKRPLQIVHAQRDHSNSRCQSAGWSAGRALCKVAECRRTKKTRKGASPSGLLAQIRTGPPASRTRPRRPPRARPPTARSPAWSSRRPDGGRQAVRPS